MKLAHLSLCGFRGYRKPLHIEFSETFTVIDGRNGVGKSTIFDAVEFALTGKLSKYNDAKADGETVADYIWWSGKGPAPEEHYVEAGFRDAEGLVTVRRTQVSPPPQVDLDTLTARLCDGRIMPKSPLQQLCASSIVRDEQIAQLSLDLKETERYALLCEAIGATDTDAWLDRGSKILSLTKKRVQAAEEEVKTSARDVAQAVRQLDEVRAAMLGEELVSAAAERLQAVTSSNAPPDQLIAVVRAYLVDRARELEAIAELIKAEADVTVLRVRQPDLEEAVASCAREVERAQAVLADIPLEPETEAEPDSLAQRAALIVALISSGRSIGTQDGCCPLCFTPHSDAAFMQGTQVAEGAAGRLSSRATEIAQRALVRLEAASTLERTRSTLRQQQSMLDAARQAISDFERRAAMAGLPPRANADALHSRHANLSLASEDAREDLRIIETLRLNAALERAVESRRAAEEGYRRAEVHLGVARKAERQAHALHDAARRAAGETLSRRLEQVLPLMSELYQRLRPHPIWDTIDYKMRGDVRKFLKFEVGEELNPQFIFSSGQRRATGLAFLLSVNLSLAWSRWQTILLDDPVQHVDDFRSIHLAELMAQLTASGRQVICAVEDTALADLLCRRLPAHGRAQGQRVTLGADLEDGAMAKLRDEAPAPLPYRAFLAPSIKAAS